ncbi:MAG: hypothetical protein OEZ34_04850 [Spirochaetia bacterium]|nr:hypothetical protein [Spirochaetia bacterium]
MKHIYKYIKQWHQEAWNLKYIIFILCFVFFGIFIEYSISLTTQIVDFSESSFMRFALFTLLFSFAYLIPLSADRWFNGNWKKKPDILFYMFIFIAVLTPSLDSAFSITKEFIMQFNHLPASRIWFKKTGDNLIQSIILFIPALIFFLLLKSKNEKQSIGFKIKDINFKPYFYFLLFMVPPVISVSFLNDFRLSYPRLRLFFFLPSDQFSPIFQLVLFQAAYGLAFVSTEFFYRGFLILAAYKYLGMRSVIPAAVLYCFVHFQKPLLETISSFPGGFLLGIITAGSGSIIGGIIVHLGIAWSMEIAGFFQIFYRGDLLLENLIRSRR